MRQSGTSLPRIQARSATKRKAHFLCPHVYGGLCEEPARVAGPLVPVVTTSHGPPPLLIVTSVGGFRNLTGNPTMQYLIPLSQSSFGDEIKQTVNGRNLHAFLDVGKDFTNWVKVQIDRARLKENRDFVVFAQKGVNPSGGRPTMEYHFTIDAAKHISMMSGTDKGYEAREYFLECERIAKQPTRSLSAVNDPVLAAIVQTIVEIDGIKQQNALLAKQQADLDRKTEILENRVQNVEIQHRNGVPDGYLSKREAHHLYGVGLSEEIFECLLVKVGVSSKRYMHLAEGYKTPSTAYLEAEIQPAVEMFLEDAVQCSAVFCMSPMLDGKRFRYVKEAFIKEKAA